MLSNNQKNTLKTSGIQADVSARVLNTDSAEQTRKSDRNKKFLLLVLLIMLLVIAQVIVLLTSSGVDQVSEPVMVSDPVITQEDIKAVNDDLKAAMKSLDETEPDEDVEVDKQVTVKPEKTVVETKGHGLQEIKLAVIAPIVISNDSSENNNMVVDKLPNYVKHDGKGESLADDTEQWTCVRDTETGLMWEVKSDKDALRDSNNLYSWYDPAHKSLPGKSDGGRCEGDSDCDTRAYVKALNDQNYCGYNDWYLPTREEMQTLVNLESANGKATINKKYFPHTVPSWYWTSSDEGNKDDLAWYVLFRNGFALSDLKERPKHIRLVRNHNYKLSNL